MSAISAPRTPFLLTPLREGRRLHVRDLRAEDAISTHAPAGGATAAERARLMVM